MIDVKECRKRRGLRERLRAHGFIQNVYGEIRHPNYPGIVFDSWEDVLRAQIVQEEGR